MKEKCKWTIDKKWKPSIVHTPSCSSEFVKPVSTWKYCPYCGKELDIEVEK